MLKVSQRVSEISVSGNYGVVVWDVLWTLPNISDGVFLGK